MEKDNTIMDNIINSDERTHLCVPISLIKYSKQNGLFKPLSIFIFLKFYCEGKIHKSSPLFTKMKSILGLKDGRTIKKHLGKLLELDWMGYNANTGNYFIRGFSRVKDLCDIKVKSGAICYPKYLKHLESFFNSSIFEQILKNHEYIRRRRKNYKAVAENRGVALQPHNSMSFPDYFGLSNSKIAELLNCKPTRATQLKHKAEKDGFIKLKHKWNILSTHDSKDAALKARIMLGEIYPKLNGALKVCPQKRKFVVVEQLFDEMETNIKTKFVCRKNRIRKKDFCIKGRSI